MDEKCVAGSSLDLVLVGSPASFILVGFSAELPGSGGMGRN